MLNPQDPKIIERYKALPRPLKDALWAEETINHIFDVGKAQHLTVSQMGELADVVGLVILGILKPEDFGSEVQRKLNLTMERANAADAIVAAINEKIFAPLREEIMNAARTPLEAQPLTGRATLPLPKGGAEKKDIPPPQPQTRKITTQITNKQTPPAPTSSQVSPPAPQSVSIFAKNIPEPPRYQGQDPYREPIDGAVPPTLSTTPSITASLASDKGSLEMKKRATPLTSDVFPSPNLSRTETSLARDSSSTSDVSRVAPVAIQKKPISWADISPEKEKATSHPDAKSALERAMNDGVVAPQSPKPKEWGGKTNAQKYQGKDPYREPL